MVKRVTIRKEGSHYVVSVGGRGMTLAYTIAEARRKQKAFQQQLQKNKPKKPRKKKYKYFTVVSGQQGVYTVQHTSHRAMMSYHTKLKQQWPYFRKQTSGKIKSVTKRKRKR